jgi:hypothetical protein
MQYTVIVHNTGRVVIGSKFLFCQGMLADFPERTHPITTKGAT